MQEKEKNDGPPSSGSDQLDSGSPFQLNAKLADRITKLANWRIDPSTIEFPENTRQFLGGHATVSRATLYLSSEDVSDNNDGAGIDESANAGCGQGSRGNDRRGKAVAVKSIHMENADDRERVLGLALREAGLLTELSHEHIVKLEGFVEDISNNRVGLVFPWEENGNLKDFVASQDWEIPERLWLIDDVAGGVEYLHGLDPPICHGDLKSINVLVTSKYRAVITDFGSARRLAQRDIATQAKAKQNEAQPPLEFQASFCPSTNTLTLTGNEYTLRWAAPELLMDDEAGLFSDIWALGWISYEVMTNSIPFQHVKKDSMVIKQVIRGDLPSVTDHVRMSLVLKLCSLMIKCWSINPNDRPTAEDFRQLMMWMPMVLPDPQKISDTGAPKPRSPDLLLLLAGMHKQQGDHVTASKLYDETLKTCADIGDSKGRARALLGLAALHRLRCEYAAAVELYIEVVHLCAEIRSKMTMVSAMLGLAEVYRLRNKYAAADKIYSQVVQMCTDSTNLLDKKGRGSALVGLAAVYHAQNEYSRAIASYTEAAQICNDLGDRDGRVTTLFGLAEVHRAQGQYNQAVALYSEAAQIGTEMGNKLGTADGLHGLAKVHLIRSEFNEAVTVFSEVIQMYSDIGHRERKASALRGLAELHRARSEYSEAVTLYSEAGQICTDVGDRNGRAQSLLGLAEAHRAQNDYDRAVTYYSEVVQICTGIDNRRRRAGALFGLAEVHRIERRFRQAVAFYSETAQIYGDLGDRNGRAGALWGLAEVHRHRKEYTKAITLFSEAMQIWTDIGNKLGRADALLCLGDVHRDQHHLRDAIRLYEQAAEIFERIGNTAKAATASGRAANTRRKLEPVDAE